MRQGLYRADLAFPYPEDGSARDIIRALKRWAGYRPTADPFPWGLAPALHDCFSNLNNGFAYAQLTLFCKGEAARRVFQPHMSSYQRFMLAGVLKHRPQLGGIFYEHLRYWVEHWLMAHELPAWPECEGISPFGYGNCGVTPEEVEQNRRDLLAVIAQATRWYERTMAKIGDSEDLDGRASGHELHHWIGGANMPKPERVPVRVLGEHEGGLIIGPDKDVSRPILDAGRDMPEYAVEADEVEITPPRRAPQNQPPAAKVGTENKSNLAEPELAAARMIRSGIIIAAGPLPERMTPEERELANYLLAYKNRVRKAPFSYQEIGRMMGCSHETIRRRQRTLEERHPGLKRVFAATRSHNGRGDLIPPMVSRTDMDDDPETR